MARPSGLANDQVISSTTAVERIALTRSEAGRGAAAGAVLGCADLAGPPTATMIGVETLGSKQVYANPWMAVREDAIRRSDGSTGIYNVVETPDIALIIPADGDRLHLVEQYRYPVAGRRWEFPSGSADQELDVDAAALGARELREETGLLAGSLIPIGTLDVAPSMFSQRCRIFLATDLTYGEPQRELEEQDMRSAWFTRADVEHMIRDGTITDAKSTAAYTLLLLHGQTPHV
ncbi:MAG: NUDIX hydrolase [Nocardioides sp.]